MEIQTRSLVLPCADVFPVAEQMMQKGCGIRFTVSGNSMWPLIRHNQDSVLLKALSYPVRIGDIVLARLASTNTKYLLHRVISISGKNMLVTAGDNCTGTDGIIDIQQIIGRVEIIYRGPITIDCNNIAWRIFFRMWCLCLPIRGTFLKPLRAICIWRAKQK
jgi:hypothetical protein